MTEQPSDSLPAEPSRPVPGESLTPGGYQYTVVHDDVPGQQRPRTKRGLQVRLRRWLPVAAVAAGATGVIVAVWLLSMLVGTDDDESRAEADVANVIGAFSEGQTGTSTRYEGELPPGFPDDMPTYPGARVVSSLLQVGGSDAAFLVVFDTEDDRRRVAEYYGGELDDDPWQLDAGQDGPLTSFHQFSKVDDANVTGVVLSTASKDEDLTTIVVSLRIIAGGEGTDPEPFERGESRRLPSGFPDAVPSYPGSTAILTAFEREPGSVRYAISFVTDDDGSDVLNFYRDELGGGDWVVADGDATGSELQGARAVDFENETAQITGRVTVGTFARDEDLTQIDVQVVQTTSGGS